jgi:hypothetical protein
MILHGWIARLILLKDGNSFTFHWVDWMANSGSEEGMHGSLKASLDWIGCMDVMFHTPVGQVRG